MDEKWLESVNSIEWRRVKKLNHWSGWLASKTWIWMEKFNRTRTKWNWAASLFYLFSLWLAQMWPEKCQDFLMELSSVTHYWRGLIFREQLSKSWYVSVDFLMLSLLILKVRFYKYMFYNQTNLPYIVCGSRTICGISLFLVYTI